MCADVASRSRSGPTDPSGWRLAGTSISDANSIRGGSIKVSCHWLWRRICRPARNRARVVPAYGFAISRCHGIADAHNSHVQVLTALTLHPFGRLPAPKDNTTCFWAEAASVGNPATPGRPTAAPDDSHGDPEDEDDALVVQHLHLDSEGPQLLLALAHHGGATPASWEVRKAVWVPVKTMLCADSPAAAAVEVAVIPPFKGPQNGSSMPPATGIMDCVPWRVVRY